MEVVGIYFDLTLIQYNRRQQTRDNCEKIFLYQCVYLCMPNEYLSVTTILANGTLFLCPEFDFHPRLTMACDSVYITRKQFVWIQSEVCPQLNSSKTKPRLSLFSCPSVVVASIQSAWWTRPRLTLRIFQETWIRHKTRIHYMNLIATKLCIPLNNMPTVLSIDDIEIKLHV